MPESVQRSIDMPAGMTSFPDSDDDYEVIGVGYRMKIFLVSIGYGILSAMLMIAFCIHYNLKMDQIKWVFKCPGNNAKMYDVWCTDPRYGEINPLYWFVMGTSMYNLWLFHLFFYRSFCVTCNK